MERSGCERTLKEASTAFVQGSDTQSDCLLRIRVVLTGTTPVILPQTIRAFFISDLSES